MLLKELSGGGFSEFVTLGELDISIIPHGLIGNYRLGRRDVFGRVFGRARGQDVVEYVGRSDTCLRGRVRYWLAEQRYARISYKIQPTSRDAFEQECRDFHDFKNLDNEDHPVSPKGESLFCPVCHHDRETC